MQVSQAPPRSLIKFKCKSEEDRFMRISKLMLSLKKQAPEEVGFSYQRIFRFLSDILNKEEFQQLSYYHVTRLINKIYEVSNLDSVGKQKANEKTPSLSQFIYKGKSTLFFHCDCFILLVDSICVLIVEIRRENLVFFQVMPLEQKIFKLLYFQTERQKFCCFWVLF